MKKPPRKLDLHRTQLRLLTANDLREVVGATGANVSPLYDAKGLEVEGAVAVPSR